MSAVREAHAVAHAEVLIGAPVRHRIWDIVPSSVSVPPRRLLGSRFPRLQAPPRLLETSQDPRQKPGEPPHARRVNGCAVLRFAAALRVTRPPRCGTVHLGSKGSLSPRCPRAKVGTIDGGKPAGRRLVCAPGTGRRPGRQRPAHVRVWERINTDGSDPPRSTDRVSGQKGGVAPVSPVPLARHVSSGLARKTRTKPAKKGKVGLDAPPPDFLTPPPLTASRFACPAPCHGTSPKRAGFPSSKYPHRLRLIDPPPVQNRSHVSACSRRCARADCDDVPRRKSEGQEVNLWAGLL